MGDDAVILEGVDSEEARASLYSTVHGAGRLFGRKEAKRRFTSARDGRMAAASAASCWSAATSTKARWPIAGCRRCWHTMPARSVLHTLRPFAVAMAGEGEFDPFRD